MFVPVMPAAAIARHRYIQAFRELGATSPERAVTLTQVGTRSSHVFRRLVGAGVFVKIPGERYYLSERGVEQWRQRQAQIVVWVLAAVTIALVVALLVAWTIR